MKPLHFTRIALALAGAALLSPARANLLTNGDFEAPLVSSSYTGPGFWGLVAPNQGIPGWTLTSGSIDVFTNFLGGGTQVLDMTGLHTAAGGAGPGSLQQSFATTVGASYDVSFLMGGGNAPIIKSLEVEVSGGSTTAYAYTFELDSSGLPAGTLTPQSFSFIASDMTSTLRFSSLVNSSWDGPLLDTVSVAASVPEAQSWALMLSGLGALTWLRRRSPRSQNRVGLTTKARC